MVCKNVPARVVLWVMTFLSYTIQYILLSNLNIAIPAMLEESGGNNNNSSTITALNEHTKPSEQGRFPWNESHVALLLGAVYWLMWSAHLVGGTVSHKFGSKLVVGFSILFGSGLSFVIPITARYYKVLMAVRVIQGFIVGLSYPSIMTTVPHWVPEHERGRFLTAFLGMNLGSALSNFLGGVVIKILNWEAFFYATGTIGLVWCFFWMFLVFDTPEKHPRISSDELEYLSSTTTPTENAEMVGSENHQPIPWSRILTSGMVISNVLAQFGVLWTLNSLILYAPTFTKLFYDMDILTVGFATGIPSLSRIPLTMIYSAYADKLIEREIMSPVNVRKLSTIISNILPGFAFVVLVLFCENLWVVLVCMGFANALSGATISGATCGFVDISPTFGDILQGLSSALGITSGFLIPLVVGLLTFDNSTMNQWRIFFSICGVISIVSGIPFLLVWKSDRVAWDSATDNAPHEPLRKKGRLKCDDDMRDKV